jgi:preprotein translocase subunit SecG
MLSFMREQGSEGSSVQEHLGDTGSAPAEASGGTQEQEFLSVTAKEKNVRKTTYLLGVLFGIGLVCLILMIKKSAPGAAKANTTGNPESRIETAIARLTGIKSEMFTRMDELLKKFYEFSNVQQVKLDELTKNPFRYDTVWGGLEGIADVEEEMSPADAYLLRQQRLRLQAKDLQLLSIMQSQQGNCCMIDDKILYEGDSIKGFKVRQISNSFVRLEWDADPPENVEIILKLSK